MHTQIACPNCRTPYSAEVHQIIDAGRNPELKHRLLNGQLNLAICPNCGTGGQLSTAMLFHDPEHELFMIYVPQELRLAPQDRERLIGQLSKQAMDALPTEQRRAYMFQPQMMLTMQSFMEKVLETEGITPEMIASQRRQAELLQTLISADGDVADVLIKERASELDETFFAMLQAYLDAAGQANDNRQMLALTNLRARLMVSTPVGRKLEKRQISLHSLNRDAKKNNGLTPAMLLRHILENREDMDVVDALATAGGGALDYTFFSLLSDELDKREAAGDGKAAKQLAELRQHLLGYYDAMQEASKRVLAEANETLKTLMAAPDLEAAVEDNISKIDDAFMYLLMSTISEAQEKGETELANALEMIHAEIMDRVQGEMPPEVMLLNKLIGAETSSEQKQILDENQHLVSADLARMLDTLGEQIKKETQQEELVERLREIRALVQARL